MRYVPAVFSGSDNSLMLYENIHLQNIMTHLFFSSNKIYVHQHFITAKENLPAGFCFFFADNYLLHLYEKLNLIRLIFSSAY